MVVPLRRWLRRMAFIALLAVLTCALYYIIDALSAWMEPGKYKVPDGRAVKAFKAETDDAGNESMLERLRLFYWYGE